jgi:F-type H+-transporting ATPase subunit a
MTDGLISGLIAEAEGGHGSGAWWGPVVWLGLIFVAIAVLLRVALGGAKQNVPRNPLTRLAEHVYLFIENMCVSVIGPHGKKYVTLVITVYLLILFSNLLGLAGLFAPTSVLGVTLALAVAVVFYVQYEGIRSNGPVGYVKHFMGPKMDNIGMALTITPLLFLIELVSEVAKNISLSFRLQGNISGEHKVGETLGSLVKIGHYELPIQWALLPLGVFVCVVQALVFTMLTCVYLSLFTSHEAEEGHAH